MNTITKTLKYLWRRCIYGGSTSLKPYEQFVLKCVEEELPEGECAVLQEQIENLEFIQHSPGKRISRVFLNRDSSYPLFNCKDPGNCMARLRISGESRSIVVEVIMHRGEIASLEFHGSPERLGNGALSLKEITLNPEAKNIDVAQAINRLEHGKQA